MYRKRFATKEDEELYEQIQSIIAALNLKLEEAHKSGIELGIETFVEIRKDAFLDRFIVKEFYLKVRLLFFRRIMGFCLKEE